MYIHLIILPVMSFNSADAVTAGYAVKFSEFPQKFGFSSNKTVPFM